MGKCKEYSHAYVSMYVMIFHLALSVDSHGVRTEFKQTMMLAGGPASILKLVFIVQLLAMLWGLVGSIKRLCRTLSHLIIITVCLSAVLYMGLA
jgi:hypothetical protein